MRIERDGVLLGEPVIAVAPGGSASMTAAGRYAIRTRVDPEAGAATPSVRLESELHLAAPDGTLTLAATPNLLTALGQDAEVRIERAETGRVALRYHVEAID